MLKYIGYFIMATPESKALVPYQEFDLQKTIEEKMLGMVKQVVEKHLSKEVAGMTGVRRSQFVKKRLPAYSDALERGRNVIYPELREGLTVNLAETPGYKEFRFEEGVLHRKLVPPSKDPFEQASFFKATAALNLPRETITGLFLDEDLVDLILKRGFSEQERVYYQFLRAADLVQQINKTEPEFRKAIPWPDVRIKDLERVTRIITKKPTSEDIEDSFLRQIVIAKDSLTSFIRGFVSHMEQIMKLHSLFIMQNGAHAERSQKPLLIRTLAIELLANPESPTGLTDIRAPYTLRARVDQVFNLVKEIRHSSDDKQFKVGMAFLIQEVLKERGEVLGRLFEEMGIAAFLGVSYLETSLIDALLEFPEFHPNYLPKFALSDKNVDRPQTKVRVERKDLTTRDIAFNTATEVLRRAKERPGNFLITLSEFRPEAQAEIIKRILNMEGLNKEGLMALFKALNINYSTERKIFEMVPRRDKRHIELMNNCSATLFRVISGRVTLGEKVFSEAIEELAFRVVLDEFIVKNKVPGHHGDMERINNRELGNLRKEAINRDEFIKNIIENTAPFVLRLLMEGELDSYQIRQAIESVTPVNGPKISHDLIIARAEKLSEEALSEHFGKEFGEPEKREFFKKVLTESLENLTTI